MIFVFTRTALQQLAVCRVYGGYDRSVIEKRKE